MQEEILAVYYSLKALKCGEHLKVGLPKQGFYTAHKKTENRCFSGLLQVSLFRTSSSAAAVSRLITYDPSYFRQISCHILESKALIFTLISVIFRQ